MIYDTILFIILRLPKIISCSFIWHMKHANKVHGICTQAQLFMNVFGLGVDTSLQCFIAAEEMGISEEPMSDLDIDEVKQRGFIYNNICIYIYCESDFTPVAKMIEEDIESWWRYLSSEKVVLPPDWRIPDPHSPFALQVAKAQDPMTSYVKNPPTSTWTIKGPSGEQTWHGSHRREWISHQREWMYGFHTPQILCLMWTLRWQAFGFQPRYGLLAMCILLECCFLVE